MADICTGRMVDVGVVLGSEALVAVIPDEGRDAEGFRTLEGVFHIVFVELPGEFLLKQLFKLLLDF